MASGLSLTSGMARGDVDLAVRAEAAGFDSVFTIHTCSHRGSWR
jgi:alkanesulfonate monooxygenase SsuD/methylene tetrahydromethanopterin reductase-like flavin-dependent oxidoreductase (luciferase family)